MAHFIITFRIGSDPGYQTRYESFVKKIHELGGGIGKVWEETTSFASLQSTLTAEALCQALTLVWNSTHPQTSWLSLTLMQR